MQSLRHGEVEPLLLTLKSELASNTGLIDPTKVAMKSLNIPLIITSACLGLLTLPCSGKPDNNGKGKGNGNSALKFNKGNQGNKGKKHLPQGLDKKDLPLGIDKKALPPGLDKKDIPAIAGTKGKDWDRFDDKEREAIQTIFTGKDGSQQLPPGLAKNVREGKPLPPGWQDKVHSGSILEREILDGFTPVPQDLVPGIRQTPGTRLYYHDNKVIRVLDNTRQVVDIVNLLSR